MNRFILIVVLLAVVIPSALSHIWPFVVSNNTTVTNEEIYIVEASNQTDDVGEMTTSSHDVGNITSESWFQHSWNFITSPFTNAWSGVSSTFSRMYLHSGAKYFAKLLATYSGPGGNETLPEDESVWWRRKYFRRMAANDIYHCITLLVCEACASPRLYGFAGNRAVAFFEAFRVTEEDGPAAAWFSSAAKEGLRSRSPDLCRHLFSECPKNATYWADTVTRKLIHRYIALDNRHMATGTDFHYEMSAI